MQQTTYANKSDEPKTEQISVIEQPEFIVDYKLRVQFREVLMAFFEQTNAKLGSYVWAENKAKEYFLVNKNIPVSAWDYRNPREAKRKVN